MHVHKYIEFGYCNAYNKEFTILQVMMESLIIYKQSKTACGVTSVQFHMQNSGSLHMQLVGWFLGGYAKS